MKRILQAMDSVSTKPVEGADDMKKFVSIINEGANPHKVALPVQMAMQHYTKPVKTEIKEQKPSVLKKYFQEVQEEVFEQQTEKDQLIKQYAQTIAERVLMKEGKAVKQRLDAKCWTGKHKEGTKIKGGVRVNNCVPNESFNPNLSPNPGFKPQGPGMQSSVAETPIAMDPDEPNNPMIHGHEKANPMTLNGRIMSARAQLKELAQLAERDDLLAWEEICTKAKGGMFMGLEQNLEQIRHGISELARKRKQGGVASRGIDKHIGEEFDSQEYNDEAGMALNNLHTVARVSTGLAKILDSDENLPEWVQEKIAVSKGMMVAVLDYMYSQHEMGIQPHMNEAVLAPIKAATPKAIKAKKKTSTCKTGQVQTGMQTKDGKLVPKCSVK